MQAVQAMTERTPAVLAIDTSSEQAGIALLAGGQVSSLAWHAGRTHTTSLLGQIHHLLDLLGLTASDLSGIAVATGPGAFTGLRVGVSVAKGFSLALGLPLVGVPTLAMTALPVSGPAHDTVAVVAAGRGRIAWARYAGEVGPGVDPADGPRNTTVEELAAEIAALARPAVVTGELSAEAEATLRDVRARVPDAAMRLRRPEAMLALALPRLAAGAADDPVALEPTYLGR